MEQQQHGLVTSDQHDTADMSKPHCWHHAGLTYLSHPPQHEEICCQCGAVRHVRYGQDQAHGPHAPPSFTAPLYTGGEGPCKRKETT